MPPVLSGLLTSEAQASDEGERGTGSYGSNGGSYGSGQSGSDNNNSFKFVCINNNNNTIVGVVDDDDDDDDGVTPPPGPPTTCEECFEQFLTEDQLSAFLGTALTLEQYCEAIEPGGILEDDEAQVRADLAGAGNIPETTIDAIIDCLQNLGLLLVN